MTRIERAVTSISWIPSEAVKGLTRLPFDSGIAHYDEPPPDVVDDLIALRDADRFRFANRLSAWIEVDDAGAVRDSGYSGGGFIGATTMRLGGANMTFAAVPLPDRQEQPSVDGASVRFVQTAGGRTGVPAPRRVKYPPFIQVAAPLAWTTLALTINADGTYSHEVVGASPFPRHWIYDDASTLVAKSGLISFKDWYQRAFGSHTPWGGEDSDALVTQVETALERELSTHIMRGGRKPRIRELRAGAVLVEQGDEGKELFLLLDGVLSVEVNGEAIAQVGPGAVLGERALIEQGQRTSTLRAMSPCRVAVAGADDIDREVLHTLAQGHRREER
ncbi:MAG: cyclic nucleotide-binding domain-containing protein [Candidatus Dormibacteraeota bacterium]|nr:cyclic nucleotide-binding domain-containing protein [Candidatus Dormibacteraeota bacterium]MBV8446173.1 cyclic nucleotide-binding domain-containing protein [Candidatus Dormibacteraeota bacterium]